MERDGAERDDRAVRKARLVAGMQRGLPWRATAAAAAVPVSRSTAYRLRQRAHVEGDGASGAFRDGRRGHASKMRAPIIAWLDAYCRGAPTVSGPAVQAALRERFGLGVSVRHINRVRAALGVSSVPRGRAARGAGGKCAPAAPPSVSPQPEWRDGAGGLLLLAAAHETDLLPALDAAVLRDDGSAAHPRTARARTLLLTLLFLNAAGLRRTWDLRGYAGDGLALLTGRGRAYGYRHAERFLAHLARAGTADPFTDALAAWTTTLWQPTSPADGAAPPPTFCLGPAPSPRPRGRARGRAAPDQDGGAVGDYALILSGCRAS